MINDYLETGKYREALESLTDMQDEYVRYQRLICLTGLNEFPQARKEAMIAKELASETYYDVVALYLTVLKELQEFEEAINIVVQELSMPYIPYEYERLFNEAYDQLLLEKQEANIYKNQFVQIFSEDELEQVLLKNSGEDALFMAIDQLAKMNIRYLLPSVRIFLQKNEASNLAKSLLIGILIEQEVDEELVVVKNGIEIDFNPVYLQSIENSELAIEVTQLLSSHVEDDNPSLFQLCLDFLAMYLYDIFPTFYDEDPNIVAASIHYYLATLQSIEFELEDACYEYYCDEEDILAQIEKFKGIDV